MRTFIGALFLLIAAGCGGGAEQPLAETQPVQQQLGVRNMPTGFQVIGDHGGIQIDENFVNMTFITKGTLALNQNDPYFTVTAQSPIVCFNGAPTATISQVVRNGNSYTYHMEPEGYSNDPNLNWFLFDVMPSASPASGNGLVVYNSSGRVTFNSDYPPMKIVALQKIPDNPDPKLPASVTVPLPPGTYAACLSTFQITGSQGGDIYWQVYYQGSFVGPDYIGAGFYTAYETLDAFGTQDRGGYLIGVDVSGL